MEKTSNEWDYSTNSRRCTTCNATTHAERGVVPEPHECMISAAPHSTMQMQEYAEVSVVAIKIEHEDENSVPLQRMGAEYAQDSRAEIGSLVKKEANFSMETEGHRLYEVTVKQELDIEPTVLQPKTTSHRLLQSSQEANFSMETEEDRLYEVTVKQELDIEPTVLQPKTTSHRLLQSSQTNICSDHRHPKLPSHSTSLNRDIKQEPYLASNTESTKASTTDVQTITSRKKTKKTNAQRCREYRERKKLQNTMVQNITAVRSDECIETDRLQVKRPKTNAERRKKHYEAQKLKKQKSKKIPKTVKQKNKEYYERRKKFKALTL